MANKTKKKTEAKKTEAKKKAQAKTSKPAKPKKREPPVAMIIRRNASPPKPVEVLPAPAEEEEDDEQTLAERMGGWHVASGTAGAVLGQTMGVVVVGRGWLGPKLTSSLILGAGLSVAAAGYYWDVDHLLSGGTGMATAGALALTNHLAVESYLRLEERADKKREAKEIEAKAEEERKRLVEAHALVESEEERKKKKQRNARRIVVLDHTGRPIDDDEREHARAQAAA